MTQRAVSANVKTHEQETKAYCCMLVRFFLLFVMHQKRTNTRTKKKYLRLWKQLDSKNSKMFFSKSIIFGVSTQSPKLIMMKGTKLIKICRFCLLKIILPLNCLVTAHCLYIYIRAFIDVDVCTSICERLRHSIKSAVFSDKNEG